MEQSKSRSNLREKYEGCDKFGKSFRFNMPGGKRNFVTSFGATMTILLYIMLISYALVQFYSFQTFNETVITSSEKEAYYDFNYAFPDDIDDLVYDNFNIAFGITAYDGDTEPIDDPKYGRILARYDSWGFKDRE